MSSPGASPSEAGPPPAAGLQTRGVLLRASAMASVAFLVLLAIGAAVLSVGGPEALARELAQMKPGWMAAAFGTMVVALLLAGPRLCVLLPETDGPRPSPLSAGTLLLASTLLNMSLPGPVGELAAAAAVQRTWNIPAPTALAASLHGRLSGLAAGGVLALAALPLLPAVPELGALFGVLGLLLGGAALGVGALSLRPHWLGRIARAGPVALAPLLPGPLGRLSGKVGEVLERVGDQLAAGLTPSPGRWLRALGWSVLSHLLFAGAVLCCAAAVGEPLAPLVALTAHIASVIGSVALIVVPGGMGAWDLSFGGVLMVSGDLSLDRAALVLLSVRMVQVLGMSASALAFVSWSRRLLGPR